MSTERNIFCNLFKYRPNNFVSPEENFITESLVYLLDMSLQIDWDLFREFISLLDSDLILSNTDNIKIETQRQFNTTLGRTAIPDISLTINNNIYLIEVKVSSDFNTYVVKKDDATEAINQIQLYGRIKTGNLKIHIYSLTVNQILDTQEFPYYKKGLLWNDIYNLFDKVKSDNKLFIKLVSEFQYFLKENDMVINHVSEKLIDGVKELKNFNNQLNTAMKELGYSVNSTSAALYSGYNYLMKEPGIRLWIGINFRNPNRIKILITNKELIQYFRHKEDCIYDFDTDNKKYVLVSFIDFFEESFFSLTAHQQKEKIKIWLDEEVVKLINYIGKREVPFSLAE